MSSGYYPSTPSYFTSPRLSIPSVLYPTSTSNSTFQHSPLQVFVGTQPSPTYPSSLPSFNDQRLSPSQGYYSHTHTTPHPHPHPHLHPFQASPPSLRYDFGSVASSASSPRTRNDTPHSYYQPRPSESPSNPVRKTSWTSSPRGMSPQQDERSLPSPGFPRARGRELIWAEDEWTAMSYSG